MSYRIYVNDCETTSLNPQADVIETSFFRFSLTDSSFVEEQKTWFMKAVQPSLIEDEALAINGHKKQDILWQTEEGRLKYLEPSIAISEIENWIMEDNVSAMDRIFAGHNAEIDANWLQALWLRQNCKDTFPFALDNGNRIFDTKQTMLEIDLCTGRRREYYNLSSCTKALGVKKGKAHQASEDVRMTKDLLVKLLGPLVKIIAETHKNSYVE